MYTSDWKSCSRSHAFSQSNKEYVNKQKCKKKRNKNKQNETKQKYNTIKIGSRWYINTDKDINNKKHALINPVTVFYCIHTLDPFNPFPPDDIS